ncbi:hypothetical protein M426DRAFT_17039 [Hypoxylon sp. CI-4A]|nr:hypothetical protein M426DRAFT_17039 [Hypoxylon sp. CI-4A]
MPPASDVDLFAPFERDVILEIRTSKMKTMPGLNIETGIDKRLRTGRIPVSFIGLDADEHDLVFHGGPDKAIHGYCCTHYPTWQKEFPEASARFGRGGFGENFVTERMNERNVCIGDIVSVGDDGVLLQVSLPRQPCFKLNHRFQLKNFAPNTFKTSRTGWYYRVLREGTVQAGDEIRLVERKWPKWTIERIQEYLHRTQDNAAMNEELAAISEMGDESRKAFERRVEKLKAKKRREAAALNGNGNEGKEIWRNFKIVEKKIQTPRITSFVLEAKNPDPEASEVQLGSHARLRLPNGLVRSYSIVSGTPSRFELGIALESASRGGSSYLHNTAKEGDILQVGRVTTDVKPAGMSSNHVFIAGGIGITAFLSMLETYKKIHWDTTLHYGVRDAGTEAPFRARIEDLKDSVNVKMYDGKKGERMDIQGIFENLPWNSHVYVCGPTRMMDEAARVAKARGLGADEVHFEAFGADTTGDPFEVEVSPGPERREKGENKVLNLQVGAEETLLEILKKHLGDDDVPSSCEVGNCGTCKVTLKSGRVDHRGTALMDDEKKDSMLSCVSRGIGKITIET